MRILPGGLIWKCFLRVPIPLYFGEYGLVFFYLNGSSIESLGIIKYVLNGFQCRSEEELAELQGQCGRGISILYLEYVCFHVAFVIEVLKNKFYLPVIYFI